MEPKLDRQPRALYLNSSVAARAPVRIDFTGGYTDVSPFIDNCVGKSVNAAIDIYTYVKFQVRDNLLVYLCSKDLSTQENWPSLHALDTLGPLGLIKRAIRDCSLPVGLNVTTFSYAPPGSGLGTSAAITVGIRLLIDHLSGNVMHASETAERAARCQREHGISGGRQDEYASCFGGVNALTFKGQAVGRKGLVLSEVAHRDLDARLALFHGRGAHSSGQLVDAVIDRLKTEPKQLWREIESLNHLADEFVMCFERSAFSELPPLIEQVFECQCHLHPRIVPDEVAEVVLRLKHVGASCKLTGGGGAGACILACFEPSKRNDILLTAEKLGLINIKFKITDYGASIVPTDEVAQ